VQEAVPVAAAAGGGGSEKEEEVGVGGGRGKQGLSNSVVFKSISGEPTKQYGLQPAAAG
jgi:hypothetical protein